MKDEIGGIALADVSYGHIFLMRLGQPHAICCKATVGVVQVQPLDSSTARGGMRRRAGAACGEGRRTEEKPSMARCY